VRPPVSNNGIGALGRRGSNPRLAAGIGAVKKKVLVLLDCASYGRENGVGIRTNQPYCAHHNYQDHCQHDCVLSYILAALIRPELI
jgi:hypothetical protein